MSKKSVTRQTDADEISAALRHKTIPTYPLSPTEIEVVIHVRWDGKTFGASERAGCESIALIGDDLRAFVIGLPFNDAYKPLAARTVEISAANDDDASWLLERAHRVQLVSTDGKLPPCLDNEEWKPGKPGVKKPDGIGILLTRPFA